MFPHLTLVFFWLAQVLSVTDVATRIDGVFQEWSKEGSPGAAVAVIQRGEIVFQKGYGLANLEYGIPITPDTVFHVASVSKQFTAMALVLLERQGKLSIDDDVRKYLPELPDYGTTITIRQLLQHTSGIRDQWQTLALAGWRLDDVITQQQILRMLFRQKELNFTPGAEHLYSNGGYTLAAEIVHRVSGKGLPEFCDDEIFRPLGMKRTHFHIDHRRIVPDRAYSYGRTGIGYLASPLNYANVGATSLFTTAKDLARWLDNFRDARVGGRQAVERLQEQAVLSNGQKIEYALGVVIGKYRGLRTVTHSGGDAGYRSHVVWFPTEELGVAVLGNVGNFNPGQAANQVAAGFLGDRMAADTDGTAPAPVERKFITLDPKTLDRFTGLYQIGPDLMIDVQKRDDKLVAAPPGQSVAELQPMSADRFYATAVNAELEFTPTADGKVGVLLVRSGTEMRGERVRQQPFDAASISDYAGSYWSDEVETQYTLRVKDGKLVADHARHGEQTLAPLLKDEFRGGQWFFQRVRFTRDAEGRVAGMSVGGGRVRGVKFVRR